MRDSCGRQIRKKAGRILEAREDEDGAFIHRGYSTGRVVSVRRDQAGGKPLSEHVADFEQALRDKGDTEQQATQVTSRVRRIIDCCNFKTWTGHRRRADGHGDWKPLSCYRKCGFQFKNGEAGIRTRGKGLPPTTV
jgi:hypothetical protein